jgi:hypothetical protein
LLLYDVLQRIVSSLTYQTILKVFFNFKFFKSMKPLKTSNVKRFGDNKAVNNDFTEEEKLVLIEFFVVRFLDFMLIKRTICV